MSNPLDEILQGPALGPPPGVVPNFIDPPNSNDWYVAVLVTCVTISTIALCARMYTKFVILKSRGWEDYTAILGWLFFIGYCITTGLTIRHGGGIHQWNVRAGEAIKAAFYVNASAIIYGITMIILKVSILIQYRRFFVPAEFQNSFMSWATYMVAALVFMFYVTLSFFSIFECNPREKAWDPYIQGGHCFDRNTINIAAGWFNVVTDFIILLLPQGAIWKLLLPVRTRFYISCIFLVGLFACVTSIFRLYYSVRLAETGDVTYNVVMMGFWTYAEMASAILCCCLPVLPKLFQKISLSWTILLTRVSGGASFMEIEATKGDPYQPKNSFNNSYNQRNEQLAERGYAWSGVHAGRIPKTIDISMSHQPMKSPTFNPTAHCFKPNR